MNVCFVWGEKMKKGGNGNLKAKLGSVHMEITGNREIIFEGCRGVLEYTDQSIKLNVGKYIVCFEGRGLRIRCMTECDLVICGFITEIRYIM